MNARASSVIKGESGHRVRVEWITSRVSRCQSTKMLRPTKSSHGDHALGESVVRPKVTGTCTGTCTQRFRMSLEHFRFAIESPVMLLRYILACACCWAILTETAVAQSRGLEVPRAPHVGHSRMAGEKDDLGHGTFVNADFGGRVTHVAAVGDRASHSNQFNPIDGETYAEATARYDLLGRPVARTRWRVARGSIYPHDPPIAGLDSVSATDGLTTRTLFDSRLNDGAGLDDTSGVSVPRLGGGNFTVNVNSAVTQLADTVANGGAGWSMDAGAAGGAAVTISHDEVLTVAIVDALGRPVLEGALVPPAGSSPNAVTMWKSRIYDETATVTGFGTVKQIREVDSDGNVVAIRIDGLGRLLETIDQTGESSRYEYDPAGNVTKVRNPNSVGVDVVYDALGRVTSQTDTAGSVTSQTYDREGNVRTATDALSAVTTLAYDSRGRLVQQTDRLSLVTAWTYDAASNVLSMTDPESKTTTYAYDDLGRSTTITFPGHNTSTSPGQAGYDRIVSERDPLGRVFRTRDQTGGSVTLLRDLLGRVTQRDYRTTANWPTGSIADSDTFTFANSGRLSQAVSGRYSNTTSFDYDEFGRKVSEELTYGANSWEVETEYDALGRAYKEIQPGSNTIERTFTARGQLHQVKRNGATIATRSYDDGGRMIEQALANGITEAYTYHDDNLLESISVPGIETRTYAYDANKNVTSETVTGALSGRGWSVPSGGRNAEDRLTAWNRADTNDARTWTLSSIGNWTASSINGSSTSRTYGDVHQPLTIGAATLQYDPRGMLTKDRDGREYAWDRAGLLQSVDTNADSTPEVTYLYDALGRKVGRSEGGTTRITPQSNWRTVAEFTTAAPTTAVESYAYGSYIDEPLQKVGTGGTVYYHQDRRFSVTALSDGSGSPVERYAYTMHGTATLFDGSGGSRSTTAYANLRMYTGVERDSTSGKDYLRNRWFEAEMGFVSRDPLGHVDGASVYLGHYADGKIDPLGLEVTEPIDHGNGNRSIDVYETDETWYINWGNWLGSRDHYGRIEYNINNVSDAEAKSVALGLFNEGLKFPSPLRIETPPDRSAQFCDTGLGMIYYGLGGLSQTFSDADTARLNDPSSIRSLMGPSRFNGGAPVVDHEAYHDWSGLPIVGGMIRFAYGELIADGETEVGLRIVVVEISVTALTGSAGCRVMENAVEGARDAVRNGRCMAMANPSSIRCNRNRS